MRPVVLKNNFAKKTWTIYAIILLLCIIGIGVALYISYFKNEKVGLPFGITDSESEKEDEYNELKIEFDKIFNNQLEILQQDNLNIKKINNQFDYVVTAFEEKKEDQYLSINTYIPYINIDNNATRTFNAQIKEKYKNRVDELKLSTISINTIYTIEYKAYIQNNILSLAIRSGYKEGSKDQKVIVDTFNYNLLENRPATINEILSLKKIDAQYVTNKIRNEVKKTQEQNQPLIDQGYNFYKRDYNSDIYNISDSTQFLYGKDGMLYVIFAYGNLFDTTEMDVVIFE